MYRIDTHDEEWIDRSVELTFVFEGEPYRGYRGDTISSALAAAGVPYLARSFKYHRPRHVLSLANHDSNALFQVDGIPNVRGDVTALRDGMRISAINTFGGLFGDKARILDKFSRFLPVGFYYKAFHNKRLFPRWERMFRALTGLGAVSLAAPRQTTPKRYGYCDVLVVGGGPSGLAAALAAASAGAQVTLVDETPRLGGRGSAASGAGAQVQSLVDAVAHAAAITVCNAVAAGYYADHWVALVDAERLTKMRAEAVVFATGVIEQPAVFRNNDLPGVMLASAALTLLVRYGVAVGREIVMIAANQEAYEVCLALHERGIGVAAIVDLRVAESSAESAAAACASLGMSILYAHAPYAAVAGGEGGVTALEVAPLEASGRVGPQRRRIACDAVLMSVGWAPASQLLLQAGGKTRFSVELQQFVPLELPAGTFAAGRMNGVYDIDARVADGTRAGSQAAAHAGFGTGSPAIIARADRRPSHEFPIIDHPEAKNFVDFDEDLQVKDLENAAQEGFDSSELLKRYSTVGMGPSQGKHSNMNALRILARVRGVGVEDLGLTTSRPMYHPVPLKMLAGRSFNAERRTPTDELHAALGAVWMPAANWRRPEYYAVAGETRSQSIEAEVRAVRGGVGLIDVGTLGKIEIYGPQAGLFLDRVYAGKFSDLKVGMTRYALMLDESGVIVDDGVVARLGSEAFYFTTTTGGSVSVFRELLRLNALWGLDCALVNVTGHRTAFNFAGPTSRQLLRSITDVDLQDESFPFLACREGHVAGIDARLMRVGFVGELGYEIHVPASQGAAMWKALYDVGRRQGLRPFGVEAQRILRLEKGHFIVGQDTDGLTDPIEAKALWAVNMHKPFFVGQRSLKILKARGPRQTLVGIELADPLRLPKECHLVIDNGSIAGRITSVTYSTTLGKGIGLAMLSPALVERGGDIEIRGERGEMLKARITATPFYDPKQARQRVDAAA